MDWRNKKSGKQEINNKTLDILWMRLHFLNFFALESIVQFQWPWINYLLCALPKSRPLWNKELESTWWLEMEMYTLFCSKIIWPVNWGKQLPSRRGRFMKIGKRAQRSYEISGKWKKSWSENKLVLNSIALCYQHEYTACKYASGNLAPITKEQCFTDLLTSLPLYLCTFDFPVFLFVNLV